MVHLLKGVRTTIHISKASFNSFDYIFAIFIFENK